MKPAGGGSTMVTNHGVGIHMWGEIGAGKRPLTSQSSCLKVPRSIDPEVGMGIFGCCGHPMEELILLCKGQVLKDHQKDRSGMMRGPGSLGANGREVSCSPWSKGCPRDTKIKSHWAFKWECREALPCPRPFPSQ